MTSNPTRDRNLIFMQIMRVICLQFLGAAVLLARAAGAQDSREVVLRVHRAGDTLSIRGATVTIDHNIEAGNTDSAGIVRVPDLEDGGHIVEVVARGYQAYFDNFKSGVCIRTPVEPSTPAFVARFAIRSKAAMNSGLQSG